MHPRVLFGVWLSVDQYAPDWLTDSNSLHWEAPTGAPGGPGLFKVQSPTKHLVFQILH